MSAEQIKNELKQLQENLRGTGSLDPELRSLLVEIDGDIQKLLRGEESSAPANSGLIERIEEAAAGFGAVHPNIAGVLRRLADGLGQMGV